uniref:Uncharacterized protein n=1 Tax=Sphaerodactylus townsendi TaxID=933632 RepID=A0ACB8EXP9_9SAUR
MARKAENDPPISNSCQISGQRTPGIRDANSPDGKAESAYLTVACLIYISPSGQFEAREDNSTGLEEQGKLIVEKRRKARGKGLTAGRHIQLLLYREGEGTGRPVRYD